jgi:hypothetical protein
MSVTSPTSASPSTSLLEWDEAAVQSYLAHIGLPQYEDVIIGGSCPACSTSKCRAYGTRTMQADVQNTGSRVMSWP